MITIFKVKISISSQHLGSNPDPGSHVVIVQTGIKSPFFGEDLMIIFYVLW